MKDDINPIFEQDCADYLKFLGFNDAGDDVGMNAPYREGADSESFFTNGPLFYDHTHGTGGNVWQLALLMNHNDRKKALQSLHDSAGIPFRPDSALAAENFQRMAAEDALGIVRKQFAINETTPKEVLDYLAGRGITSKSWPLLGFIPEGALSTVLSQEQIELTGLGAVEGWLILWYLKNDRPVYWCARAIDSKDFRKAPVKYLHHPIWNAAVLYREKNVIWGEGFFDGLSLIELDYAVCGEITCHTIKAHEEELRIALRWRQKHMPDGKFTICLDNDAPTANGNRPGNEAAEKLAMSLYAAGIDQWWVRHEPDSVKIDINDLHKAGRDQDIHRMLNSAKKFSELVKATPEMIQTVFYQVAAEGDFRSVGALIETYLELKPDDRPADVIKELLAARTPYRSLYRGIRLYLYEDEVYVIPDRALYRDGSEQHEVFNQKYLINNIRKYQRNPALRLKFDNLDVPAMRPYWRVTNKLIEETNMEFNLFRPSPLLLQEPEPDPAKAALPSQFALILDNLAGPAEKEWLLNHMATYAQTLGKPRTIPILLGHQGSGKNTLIELFGRGIGGFIAVGKDLIDSPFNQYLLYPVILLDELITSNADAKTTKSKMKSFINEMQTIHPKGLKPYPARLNYYLAVSSNEQVVNVPVIIEKDDRRYTVITGGKDQDLATVPKFDFKELERQLPDFMLYLLSRGIDEDAANRPLENEARSRLKEQGEDPRVSAVKEWIDGHKHDDPQSSVAFTEIIVALVTGRILTQRLTSAQLRNILESLKMTVGKRDNQWHCFGVWPGFINPEEAAASIHPCLPPQPKIAPPRGNLTTNVAETETEKGVKGT